MDIAKKIDPWTLFTSSYLQEDIPYKTKKPISVPIPKNVIGKVNLNIDDSIAIALDKKDNTKRVSTTVSKKTESNTIYGADCFPSCIAIWRIFEMQQILLWEQMQLG